MGMCVLVLVFITDVDFLMHVHQFYDYSTGKINVLQGRSG